MSATQSESGDSDRRAPLEIGPEDFRSLGYRVVDQIADFLSGLPDRPVAAGETASQIRTALGGEGLPQQGSDPGTLLDEAASLLFNHSTFNGHPKFLAYITSSAAPVGALGDLLAASVNPNLGAWFLSPMASEIEAQTVRWIAELIGFPTDCGGLLVSGGNMANFVGFIVAQRARLGWNVRDAGIGANPGGPLRVYASVETHSWVQKACDLFGIGLDSLRSIPSDTHRRMDTKSLRETIVADRANGDTPFMVIGAAGSVMTGSVDPLRELAAICRENELWFHVDGAYGGFAAALPDASDDLVALESADSVAIDPHKWLYAPLEAGCVLVRDATLLRNAFSFHPPYYLFEDATEAHIDYHEYGPQNSRGFRALKVWLALRQAGRDGYVRMLADDIAMARHLLAQVTAHTLLEPWTQDLSISTFRFVPADLDGEAEAKESYLNVLNTELLHKLQTEGKVYLSNAVVAGTFLLRACVVNFRTTVADMDAIPEIVATAGMEVDRQLRAQYLGDTE